jgi:hypothetical protein
MRQALQRKDRKGGGAAINVGSMRPRAHPADVDGLADVLNEAAYVEMDMRLADALVEASALAHALEAGQGSAETRGWSDQAFMIRQSLSAVCRRRGIETFGEIGRLVSFDPERHGPSNWRAGARVRLATPGAERRTATGAEVMVKALVCSSRKRPPAR